MIMWVWVNNHYFQIKISMNTMIQLYAVTLDGVMRVCSGLALVLVGKKVNLFKYKHALRQYEITQR